MVPTKYIDLNLTEPDEGRLVRAHDAQQLKNDENFVVAVYLACLDREPDPDGLGNYLLRCRDGVSRLQVIHEVLSSPECRSGEVEFSALRRLFTQAGDLIIGNRFFGPAYDVKTVAKTYKELIQLNGSQFVSSAYLTLLGRSADIAGHAQYLTRLRSGAAKLQILREISNSKEARAAGINLPGLAGAILTDRLTRLPFLGKILNFLGFTETIATLHPVTDEELAEIEKKALLELYRLGELEKKVTFDLNDSNPPQYHQIKTLLWDFTWAVNQSNEPDYVTPEEAWFVKIGIHLKDAVSIVPVFYNAESEQFMSLTGDEWQALATPYAKKIHRATCKDAFLWDALSQNTFALVAPAVRPVIEMQNVMHLRIARIEFLCPIWLVMDNVCEAAVPERLMALLESATTVFVRAGLDREQLDWLQRDLAESRAELVAVYPSAIKYNITILESAEQLNTVCVLLPSRWAEVQKMLPGLSAPGDPTTSANICLVTPDDGWSRSENAAFEIWVENQRSTLDSIKISVMSSMLAWKLVSQSSISLLVVPKILVGSAQWLGHAAENGVNVLCDVHNAYAAHIQLGRQYFTNVADHISSIIENASTYRKTGGTHVDSRDVASANISAWHHGILAYAKKAKTTPAGIDALPQMRFGIFYDLREFAPAVDGIDTLYGFGLRHGSNWHESRDSGLQVNGRDARLRFRVTNDATEVLVCKLLIKLVPTLAESNPSNAIIDHAVKPNGLYVEREMKWLTVRVHRIPSTSNAAHVEFYDSINFPNSAHQHLPRQTLIIGAICFPATSDHLWFEFVDRQSKRLGHVSAA